MLLVPDDFRAGLDRAIYIRRHGDGFRVTVEPYPALPDDMQSLNRRYDSIAAARSWAQGTQQRKGWPVVDETGAPLTTARPSRRPHEPKLEQDREASAFTRAEFAAARSRCRRS